MEKKPRLLVFVDEANVTRAASKLYSKSFEWQKFRDFLVDYGDSPRELVEMAVYVGMPPDQARRESRSRYVHFLRSLGFLVYTKEGQLRKPSPNYPRPYRDQPVEYKANVDVIMAIDAMDLSRRIRPDVVTLVTGDSDFAHLAHIIRREGIRVEVASAPQTLSSELRTSANELIDLTKLFSTFPAYEPRKSVEIDQGATQAYVTAAASASASDDDSDDPDGPDGPGDPDD
ncbi:MAG: NYN domain-containing protein [Deltaproteobacteria bacterium]|jgi:uncharacterized LabA/DUF88 family protein|nr:NYN domain-containing protein [Deltaproteobacteria bacterium]